MVKYVDKYGDIFIRSWFYLNVQWMFNIFEIINTILLGYQSAKKRISELK